MQPVDSRFHEKAMEKIQPVIKFAQTITDGLPKIRVGQLPVFVARRPAWEKFSPPDHQAQKTELIRLIREKACRNLLAHGTQYSSTLAQIFYDKELRLSTRYETCGNLYSESGVPDGIHGGYKDYGWGVFILELEVLRKQLDRSMQAGEERMIFPIPSIRAVLFPSQIVSILRTTYPEHALKIKGYVEFGESL